MINKRDTTGEGAHEKLVCTVTTVKDNLANIQEFVRRNLAAGVDHMFVFLDDADPDIHTALLDHPHVTSVRTGKRYWQGRRPPKLNSRQVINANVANVLLAPFPEVRWLFHIDGDECLDIDKDALLAVEGGYRAVHLQTLEAVAQAHWTGPVSHFKRPLEPDDLQLLAALGIIDRPSMRRYFRGHLAGKPGVTPSLDLHLRIHYVEDSHAERAATAEDDSFCVLHYESFSGEEFVRKWSAHLSARSVARFKKPKDRVRAAVTALLTNEALTDTRRQELLMEVYRRNMEDDLATLLDLGFLVQPDPSHHSHRPSAFTRSAQHDLDTLTELLVKTSDKSSLAGCAGLPRRPALMGEVRSQLGQGRSSLAERLDAALSGCRA